MHRYHGVRHDARLLAHLDLDRISHLGMIPQELLGVLPPLPDPLAVVAEPRSGFLHHARLHAEIDQLADLADTLAVYDVELDLAEWRGQLVLHHFYARLVADHLLALLDLADAPDLQPQRGIEFQRVAAGGGLRIAEHHADLHADLVEEDQHALAARDAAGELAQRLAHQPRVQAHVAVAHLAFQLGARHQGCDAVHHEHV